MRALLAATLALAIAGTGCVVVAPPRAVSRSSASTQKCPPGHQWSDGRCHGKGKGHDRAKHDR